MQEKLTTKKRGIQEEQWWVYSPDPKSLLPETDTSLLTVVLAVMSFSVGSLYPQPAGFSSSALGAPMAGHPIDHGDDVSPYLGSHAKTLSFPPCLLCT